MTCPALACEIAINFLYIDRCPGDQWCEMLAALRRPARKIINTRSGIYIPQIRKW